MNGPGEEIFPLNFEGVANWGEKTHVTFKEVWLFKSNCQFTTFYFKPLSH